MATKKPFRFYSREEYRALMPFIQSKTRIKHADLEPFCKKYDRSLRAVCQYIHHCRTKKKYGRAKRNSSKISTLNNRTNVASIRKGEFKVPINNWNITFEEGKAFFTVNF